MKRYLDYFWPLLGLVAVVMSVQLLYEKLKSEAAKDQATRALLATSDLWSSIKIIAGGDPASRLRTGVYFHAGRLCRARLVRPHRADPSAQAGGNLLFIRGDLFLRHLRPVP